MTAYKENPAFHDRIVPSLRCAREKLCVAQTDMHGPTVCKLKGTDPAAVRAALGRWLGGLR